MRSLISSSSKPFSRNIASAVRTCSSSTSLTGSQSVCALHLDARARLQLSICFVSDDLAIWAMSLPPASGQLLTKLGSSPTSIVASRPASPPLSVAERTESACHIVISPMMAPGIVVNVCVPISHSSVPESSRPNHVPGSPCCTTTCSASKLITEKCSASDTISSSAYPRKMVETDWTNVSCSMASSLLTSDCSVFFTRIEPRRRAPPTTSEVERREVRVIDMADAHGPWALLPRPSMQRARAGG